MIFLKTEEEIALMRAANQLVGKTLGEVAKLIKPGVTTNELTRVAEEFIRDNGAEPTFKGYRETRTRSSLWNAATNSFWVRYVPRFVLSVSLSLTRVRVLSLWMRYSVVSRVSQPLPSKTFKT